MTKVTDSKPEEVKDAVISIRISSKTLQRVKAKAEKKGVDDAMADIEMADLLKNI